MNYCKDPKNKPTAPATIRQLQAFMNGKKPKSFDDIRAGVADLAGKPDNEIEQAIQDSGFITTNQA